MRKEQNRPLEIKKEWATSVISVIFPSPCAVCGTKLFGHEEFLCRTCLGTLPFLPTTTHRHPFLDDRINGRLNLHHVFAMLKFERGNQVQPLLHQIKYRNGRALAEYLGLLFGQRIQHQLAGEEVILVPVPLSKQKMRIRGYNQSEVIAGGMSQILDCAVRDDFVTREAGTISQTKMNRFQRWHNVKNSFKLLKPPPNAHIIFVDDVMTTGATFESLIRPFEGHPNRISVAALSYAN